MSSKLVNRIRFWVVLKCSRKDKICFITYAYKYHTYRAFTGKSFEDQLIFHSKEIIFFLQNSKIANEM